MTQPGALDIINAVASYSLRGSEPWEGLSCLVIRWP